jgi:hypothetical protein
MTWREIMSWLTQLDVEVPSAYHGSKMHGHGFGQLGLRDVSGATAGLANAPHATRLLAALRLGHVYPQLLAHVSPQGLGPWPVPCAVERGARPAIASHAVTGAHAAP